MVVLRGLVEKRERRKSGGGLLGLGGGAVGKGVRGKTWDILADCVDGKIHEVEFYLMSSNTPLLIYLRRR